MPTLGQINKLKVIEKVANGVYLDGADLDEIFLSSGEVPEGTDEGDFLDVFLYLDTRDSIVATTSKPHAVVGQCAKLKVLSVGQFGAFLDWGIGKDLLLPHSEQAFPVEEGNSYVVYVFQDERSGRAAASTKLHFHLDESSGPYATGDQVDLLIAAKTELGYKAVINGAYLGLIHKAELSHPLQFGDTMKGWIRSVRDDGKVDLSINTLDNETRSELEQAVLDKLKESGGSLNLSDKSSPEEIYAVFKVSKKNFKRAIGGLYKTRMISIDPGAISLTGNTKPQYIKSKSPNSNVAKAKAKSETSNAATASRAKEAGKSVTVARRTSAFKDSLQKTKKSNVDQTSKDRAKAEHSNAHIYRRSKPS